MSDIDNLENMMKDTFPALGTKSPDDPTFNSIVDSVSPPSMITAETNVDKDTVENDAMHQLNTHPDGYRDPVTAELLDQMNDLSCGMTEDNIPLNSKYWAVRDKLQQYLSPKD